MFERKGGLKKRRLGKIQTSQALKAHNAAGNRAQDPESITRQPFPRQYRPTFRPTAVTAGPSTIRHPRRPLRGQRGCMACPRLPIPGNHAAHIFQGMEDFSGCPPILGRPLQGPSMHRKGIENSVQSTPARLHAYGEQPCPDAPTNRHATCPESGSLPVCFPALKKKRRPPTLSECRFIVPSVRVRLSSMPFNPAASTHTIRVILCLRLCAAIAVLFAAAVINSVVNLHRTAFAASDALAHPRRARPGKRGWSSPFTRPCRVRVRGSRHSGQDGRHTPGAAEPSLRKRRPTAYAKAPSVKGAAFKERVALRRHPRHYGTGLSPQSSPGGQHPL